MDPIEHLSQVESLYQTVLDLTREQAQHLSRGEVSVLPSILNRKTAALGKAQILTCDLQQSGNDLTAPECQAVLGRIAHLLRNVMQAEEQCQNLVPGSPKPHNRSAAAAAYGKKTGVSR